MSGVTLTRAALRDLERVRDHLIQTAGVEVALRFLDAFERCIGLLAEFPKGGASWDFVGHGIRRWNVHGFPYGLFYRNEGDRVVILRILHSARDIPATLRGP